MRVTLTSSSVSISTASPLPVSGTVAVSNFPSSTTAYQGTVPWVVNGSASTQPVVVNNFPAVQAVSGTVTVGNLQPQVSTVTVVNFPSSTTVFQGSNPWITNGSASTQPVTVLNFPTLQAVSLSSVQVEGFASSINQSSGTVVSTTTATQVLPADSLRRAGEICNLDQNFAMFCGNVGVLVNTGHLLNARTCDSIETFANFVTDAIFCIGEGTNASSASWTAIKRK